MAKVKIGDEKFETQGQIPMVGVKAPMFTLVDRDLNDFSLSDFLGRRVVLNIFPSVDTPVCANSIRTFNERASEKENVCIICVSRDLPFAQARFCGAAKISKVKMGSEFRENSFSDHYHTDFVNGPLRGLLSRAVIVLDETHHVIYSEQVKDIGKEPSYDAILGVL